MGARLAHSLASADLVYSRAGAPIRYAPRLCIDLNDRLQAEFETSRGTVRVELDVANTPGTVNSFVNLARYGYYDNTLLHRSDPSIGILQGGSPP